MTEAPVLIDTSAWITSFRDAGSETAQRVRQAIEYQLAATCGVIRAELLCGTRTENEYVRMNLRLDILRQIPITEACWRRAAWLGFRLKRKGQTVPLSDLVIAAAAQEVGAELVHCDAHFHMIDMLGEPTH